MELGIDRFLFMGPNAPSGANSNPVPDLLEEIRLADEHGLAAFGIGEHHSAEFGDSSPAILLAAAAAQTRQIRLSSAITILSVADPVRIMEDFASLDLVSNGRAEIIAGRGAYAEAFSLFGGNMALYDELYAEKMDLLLRLRSGKPVHWQGRFRPPLTGQVTYPRPVQPELPVWVAATGTGASFQRAGTLGLPLALGTIGGSISRLRPLVDLYRDAGRKAGHPAGRLKVALHAIGFVGDAPDQARSAFFPGYKQVFGPLGLRAGWPALTEARFRAMTGPDEALFVGGPDEIVAKLMHADEALGGVNRVCLQMTVGPLPRIHRLGTIERLAKVARSLRSDGA